MKANKYTHKGWLPIFPGFYGTIFEPDACESEIEYWIEETGNESLTYDDLEWDYDSYKDNVVNGCIEYIDQQLRDLGFNIDIVEEKLVSPKFYNYSNDSINCTYIFDAVDLKRIKLYLNQNYNAFRDYIKELYTSRSGFISRYSNKANDWLEYLHNLEQESEGHQFSQILQFILINELGNDLQWDMYNSIDGLYLTANLPDNGIN